MVRRRRSNARFISATAERSPDTAVSAARWDTFATFEVAAVPGEAFGSPGYLRFSYALGDDDLVEGITRLQKLFG